jgi:beta-N-acetylhexosaminidase
MGLDKELRRAAGQLLFVGFDGLESPASLLSRISAGEVGGVILFARNLSSPRQVAELTRELASAAPADAPLLVGIDQEGGRVQRLRAPLAAWPPMRSLAARDDPELTRAVGQAIGCDLALLGFNLDFAPVLDVVESERGRAPGRTERTNTVIGDRCFGARPEEVSLQALAFARGLREGGVLPCGKHFPGHGGPVADSHLTLPVDTRPEGELNAVDLPPFLAAIDAGFPLLMSAHVLYPALDPEQPATLSHRICTGLLREQLGFQGALVSDDLEMGAIAGRIGPAEAALGALRAGVDLLLFCHLEERQLAAQEAVARAARESSDDRARLEQAARRVRVLKRRLPSPAPVELDHVEELVRAEAHAALLARIAG